MCEAEKEKKEAEANMHLCLLSLSLSLLYLAPLLRCEKPFAVTMDEAEEMVKVCRENGVLLMDNTMWTHHLRAKEMVPLC